MAGYKANRNSTHIQRERYWNGQRVKPTRYYSSKHKGIMCGSVDGELVRDVNGNVVPWHSI